MTYYSFALVLQIMKEFTTISCAIAISLIFSLKVSNAASQCILDSQRCFILVTDPVLEWISAENYCESRFNGGFLASIRNAFEMNMIQGIIHSSQPTTDVWIGGFSTANSPYQWTDGEQFFYNQFAPGQPDPSGACIQICSKNEVGCQLGKWKAIPCVGIRSSFLCEYVDNGFSTSSISSSPSSASTCTPPPTQSPPYPCQADIILLLDASNGTTPAEFALQQKFINEQLLDAHWTFSQLAVGGYGDNNPNNFEATSPQFGTIQNLEEAQFAVNSIYQFFDTASIATGLQQTLIAFEGKQPCVKQVTVVFASTSDPQDVAAALPYAQRLQALGPVVFVAMGWNVNAINLVSLATPGGVISWPNLYNTAGVADNILLAFNCFPDVKSKARIDN